MAENPNSPENNNLKIIDSKNDGQNNSLSLKDRAKDLVNSIWSRTEKKLQNNQDSSNGISKPDASRSVNPVGDYLIEDYSRNKAGIDAQQMQEKTDKPPKTNDEISISDGTNNTEPGKLAPNGQRGLEPTDQPPRGVTYTTLNEPQATKPLPPGVVDGEFRVLPDSSAPDTAKTPPSADQPPNPDAPEADQKIDLTKQKEDAEILRLQQDLAVKRDAYIKARAVTRSFWRNLVGNIVAFGSAEVSSPMAHREAMRLDYESARNALVKLQAETAVKRQGLTVPDLPAALAAGASDDEKTAHAEQTAQATADREKYDQEVLAQAINLISLEKSALAQRDFENMNQSGAIRQALERLAKNPIVRMAVTGGLLASTATGFLPGIAAFGAAQAGLSVVGMKGALDFGAEQYAARLGDERKNLTTEQLMQMDQAERDRRDAALLEMGIKRGHASTEAESKLYAITQEEAKVAVEKVMAQGKIEGNTPEERSASVLAALLKEGNLNGAIDSKIDRNRRWNAARWMIALAGTAVMSGWINTSGISSGEVPATPEVQAAPVEVSVAPQPTIETSTIVPWEHASGHGYSWTGWQEGQIREYLKMAPNFQGEADVQNWISSHPAEYAQARNALTEAMQKVNPGVDFASQGVVGQGYKMPTNLRGIIGQAIRLGTNVS